MFTVLDSQWMARALRLAERGMFSASPNPRVGCVLVCDDKLIGEGWHVRAGEPHAEAIALRAAGKAARGATAYITLEPCSHHGRTPPCADALINSGVARVVVAVQDPNPQVAGRGLATLRAVGIAVECGLMEDVARELNIGFFARMTQGMPWLRSKIALSVDGRTALNNGISQWITGSESRQDGQRWRARSCAVMTGIGTVLADDPLLTVRDIESSRQPLRVVLDSQLRLPLTARLVQQPGVVVYTAASDSRKIAALTQMGVQLVILPEINGRMDLISVLSDLASRECNEVLVEAGSVLNGALLQAGLVDEMLLYLAPQLLGEFARSMVQLGELVTLDQRIELEWRDIRQVGNDLRIIAHVKRDRYV